MNKEQSDGSTALYYELPENATELQELISAKNMNAQIGEIFRACYRYGEVAHSPEIRDIKKILFYAKAELERLNKLGGIEKIVANEGLVFVYNGKTYKLTGTFAPLNQILGIFYS